MKTIFILILVSAAAVSAMGQNQSGFASVTGQCGNDGNLRLDWIANGGKAANDFAVQESVDGTTWMNIGLIKAGTTANYSYTINETTGPVTYYRIQQNDAEGRPSFSKVIKVASCSLAVSALNVDPNTNGGSSLTGRIDIGPNESFPVEVINATGRTITRGAIRQTDFRLDLPANLPAGLYYARIVSGTSATVTPFVVK
jgi:hypothetical protein